MISILMSSFREDVATVQTAIDSILAQDHIADLQLIFVLDDPENHDLRQWARANLAESPNAILIENASNQGLARSLNTAIAKAEGQYLCRMDCDDIALPHRLASQQTFLEDYGLDLIGGRMEVVDQSGQPLYTTPRLPMFPDAVRRAARWNNSVPHPTWFGRREVFEQLYRDIPLCEDYDFQLRALLAGFRLGNTDEVVLKYRISPQGISQTGLYRQYLYQRYITSRYQKGEAADIAAANHYVSNRADERRAQRYANANRQLNATLASPKPNLQQALALLAACASSPAHVGKMIRLSRAALIGRNERRSAQR